MLSPFLYVAICCVCSISLLHIAKFHFYSGVHYSYARLSVRIETGIWLDQTPLLTSESTQIYSIPGIIVSVILMIVYCLPIISKPSYALAAVRVLKSDWSQLEM